MAPIEFEENIREKLEGREIQPSMDSWKKLSGQIDTVEKKSENSIMWYAIAASFVGILIAASVFLSKSDDNTKNTTDLVEVNTLNNEEIEDNIQNGKNHDLIESIPLANVSEEIEDKKIKNERVDPVEVLNRNDNEVVTQKPVNSNTTEKLAKIDVPINKETLMSIEKTPLLSEKETAINAKVEELIAKLEQLKIKNTSITVEELDVLMANAQNEIQGQGLLNSKKVDPAELLGDVELEMEQSIRDKVYYTLGDGFQLIKTAVVERNN